MSSFFWSAENRNLVYVLLNKLLLRYASRLVMWSKEMDGHNKSLELSPWTQPDLIKLRPNRRLYAGLIRRRNSTLCWVGSRLVVF
jgi:hypothetical protein